MKIKNKDCLEEDMDCINVKQYYELAVDTENYCFM